MTGTFPHIVATFPLNAKTEVRVCLDTFNGRPRLDLRTWCDFTTGAVDARGPTKKGVSLPIEDLPALALALGRAEALAYRLGFLTKGGAAGK